MIPGQFTRRVSAGGPSVTLMVAGAVGVVLLAFIGWVVVGMATPPVAETQTVDVPVSI